MPIATAGSQGARPRRRKSAWCVYILRCADRSLYTGITNNLARRLETHRRGRGSKYVSSRKPFRLVYTEDCATHGDALRREWELKKMKRPQKIMLIADPPGGLSHRGRC